MINCAVSCRLCEPASSTTVPLTTPRGTDDSSADGSSANQNDGIASNTYFIYFAACGVVLVILLMTVFFLHRQLKTTEQVVASSGSNPHPTYDVIHNDARSLEGDNGPRGTKLQELRTSEVLEAVYSQVRRPAADVPNRKRSDLVSNVNLDPDYWAWDSSRIYDIASSHEPLCPELSNKESRNGKETIPIRQDSPDSDNYQSIGDIGNAASENDKTAVVPRVSRPTLAAFEYMDVPTLDRSKKIEERLDTQASGTSGIFHHNQPTGISSAQWMDRALDARDFENSEDN